MIRSFSFFYPLLVFRPFINAINPQTGPMAISI